jgi:hypothetical protein
MADIILNITVPDEHTQRVIDAVDNFADKKLYLRSATGSEISFEYIEKQPEETVKQYGERWLRTLGIQLIRLNEYKEDESRYKDDISSLIAPSESVPEDILE